MTNLSRISITLATLAGFAGIALAGDNPPPAPAKPAPAPAPAPAPVKPVPPPADKKVAPVPPPPVDKAPPAAEMPKPPADIAAAFKAMAGNWKCTGTAMDMGAMKEMPTKGLIKSKMDLDGWWIVTSFAELKPKSAFKFTSYTSFDGKKWSRSMFDNMGGREVSESAGMKDNKLLWDGSTTSPMGAMKSRHTEEVVSPKEVHMFGEYSQDGKQWMKAYDINCKK